MTLSGMLAVVGDEKVGPSLVCVQQLRVHRLGRPRLDAVSRDANPVGTFL